MHSAQAPISVIIPCYRCTDTIVRAVDSINNQTLKPTEVILVEDCGGGDTLNILYRLQNSYPHNWIKVIALAENGGPGTARNIGWEAATQPYIAFLDADDSWHPQKIEIQYNWMAKHPNVTLTGHKSRILKDKNYIKTSSQVITNGPKQVKKNQLLLSNMFPTRSVMLHRNIKQRFKNGKSHSEDYLLWLQICLNHQTCYKFNNELAFLYKEEFGEAGLSSQLWNMEKGELLNYQTIYKQNLINIWQLTFFSIFSFLKFLRRYTVVKLRLN